MDILAFLKSLPKVFQQLSKVNQDDFFSFALDKSFILVLRSMTNQTYQATDCDEFDTVFKLYFVNSYLIAHNSPLLFLQESTKMEVNFLNLLYIVDSSQVVDHLDEQIDIEIHTCAYSFSKIIHQSNLNSVSKENFNLDKGIKDNICAAEKIVSRELEQSKELNKRRLNKFEKSIQKQITNILQKMNQGEKMGTLLDPYQICLTINDKCSQQLLINIQKLEQLQIEKITLQKIKVQILEIMDKITDGLEKDRDQEDIGKAYNTLYTEDDQYFEMIKQNVNYKIQNIVDNDFYQSLELSQVECDIQKFMKNFSSIEQGMQEVKQSMKQTVDPQILRTNLQKIEVTIKNQLSQIVKSSQDQNAFDIHYYIYDFLKLLLNHKVLPQDLDHNEGLSKSEDINQMIRCLDKIISDKEMNASKIRDQFEKIVNLKLQEIRKKYKAQIN